jgi:hypothetical protein
MMEADLTEQIIGAAIEVHKHWGPGLMVLWESPSSFSSYNSFAQIGDWRPKWSIPTRMQLEIANL